MSKTQNIMFLIANTPWLEERQKKKMFVFKIVCIDNRKELLADWTQYNKIIGTGYNRHNNIRNKGIGFHTIVGIECLRRNVQDRKHRGAHDFTTG